MEPATVGRYRILASVGRGGSGEVFRAVGPDGWEVALKLLHTHGASEVQKKRLLREAKALLKLGDHPNVVRIVDAGEDRGRPFLALAWVPSESLEERLEREGPLDPRAAAALVAKLARAVAHCHAQGVLHRDLKPGNVLVRTWDGEPLLTDFGLTRDLGDSAADATALTVLGRFLGTPGYWSPEQAQGDIEKVGTGTDVWGLGGVLHAVLTGKPPVPGENLLQVLAALEQEPRPPSALRPGIPPELDAVCHRCLALDPARRWPDAESLARELERWLASLDPAPRTSRRVRVLAAAIALGGAAVAAAVAWPRAAPLPGAGRPGPATARTVPPPAPLSALLPPAPAPSPREEDIRAALAAFEPREALAALDAAESREGTSTERSLLRARALDLDCQFDGAIRLARGLAEDESVAPGTRYEALLLLAHLLPGSQMELHRRAFTLDPARPEARSRLALTLLYSGAKDQAQLLMDEVGAATTEHGEVLRTRAALLWELGKDPADAAILARAKGLLRRAIELDRFDAEAWALLAWVERDPASPDQALAAWKRAWELRQEPEPPHEAPTHFGRVARRLREELERDWDPGRYRLACAIVDRALLENTRHSQALGERGLLWLLAVRSLPEAERPQPLGQVLGELAWAWWVNPCNLESVRAVPALLALGTPLDPPGGRRLRTCLRWLEDGPKRCFPTDPDVAAAEEALRAAKERQR